MFWRISGPQFDPSQELQNSMVHFVMAAGHCTNFILCNELNCPRNMLFHSRYLRKRLRDFKYI
jgi:hypothetical protein